MTDFNELVEKRAQLEIGEYFAAGTMEAYMVTRVVWCTTCNGEGFMYPNLYKTCPDCRGVAQTHELVPLAEALKELGVINE